MYSGPVLALLVLGWVAGSYADCPTCPCANVDVDCTSLKELFYDSPLYGQACSNVDKGKKYDSLCFNFTSCFDSGSGFLQEIITCTDKTVSGCCYVVDTICRGEFLALGFCNTYKLFVLGSPCDGTYVLYLCYQQKDCCDERNNPEVIIVSKYVKVSPDCINKGIQIARSCEEFSSSVSFFTLPRTVPNPCSPFNSVPCGLQTQAS